MSLTHELVIVYCLTEELGARLVNDLPEDDLFPTTTSCEADDCAGLTKKETAIRPELWRTRFALCIQVRWH